MAMAFAVAIPLAIFLSAYTKEAAAKKLTEVVATSTVAVATTTPQEVKLVVVPTKIEWTRERIIEEIRATFPEAPNTAVAIADCESSFKMVQSHHIQPYGREESFGIFQIHARAHHGNAVRLGYGDYQTDPGDNIKMARHIYDSAGKRFTPWTCYTKGMI